MNADRTARGQHNGANLRKVENETSPFRHEGHGFENLCMPFKQWDLDDSPETRSDAVLQPVGGRKLTCGRLSDALSLDAKKFRGLVSASAEKRVSFVTVGFGLAELLWGTSPDLTRKIMCQDVRVGDCHDAEERVHQG